MFVYLMRNLKQFVVSLRRPALSPLEEASLNLRVRMTDLDYNMHMNNARYLESLEMARFDMMTRTGLAQAAFKKGLVPVVGAIQIIYRSSLSPFQSYTVKSKVVGWDDKWIYMEQDMVSPKKVHATAVVKAAFLEKGKSMDPQKLMEQVGIKNLVKPKTPDYIHTVSHGLAKSYEAMKGRHEAKKE